MFVLSLLLLPVNALGDKAAKQSIPSMALLEFLADMQEVDGKLLSAMDMQLQASDKQALGEASNTPQKMDADNLKQTQNDKQKPEVKQ